MHAMRCIAIIGAVQAVTSTASADLVIDEANGLMLDVTATAGTGSSTAYFVFDFEYTGGDSWAFAYNFDGDATAHELDACVKLPGLLLSARPAERALHR